WVREQEGLLRRLPVVVFSSSELAGDVNRAYDLGANSFLIKPTGLTEYQETARTLENYWIRINRPPVCVPEPPASDVLRRFFLHSLETGKYLQATGEWTAEAQHAFGFQNMNQAYSRA